MDVNVEVKTQRSGREYRATVRDQADRLVGKYLLMLDGDGMVHIYTRDSMLGLYRLDRFGDALSPVTIRQFFIHAMAGDNTPAPTERSADSERQPT